ncbi:MAG: hypothetical protein CMB99_00790 [Flavobacteriaceae bacterium]|nr:hypothetical protein [Flavobacteriaceae bacterium]
MELKVLVDEQAAALLLKSAEYPKDGDTLYLAEPQHIHFATEIRYRSRNDCHRRYAERGLLFERKIDAVMFSKSFVMRAGE